MMDSEEAISGQFDGFLSEPLTIYDEVGILDSLTLEQTVAFAEQYFDSASIQSEIIQAND